MKVFCCDICHSAIPVNEVTQWCKCGNIGGKYFNFDMVEVEVEDKNKCRIVALNNSVRYGQKDRDKMFVIHWDDRSVKLYKKGEKPDKESKGLPDSEYVLKHPNIIQWKPQWNFIFDGNYLLYKGYDNFDDFNETLKQVLTMVVYIYTIDKDEKLKFLNNLINECKDKIDELNGIDKQQEELHKKMWVSKKYGVRQLSGG